MNFNELILPHINLPCFASNNFNLWATLYDKLTTQNELYWHDKLVYISDGKYKLIDLVIIIHFGAIKFSYRLYLVGKARYLATRLSTSRWRFLQEEIRHYFIHVNVTQDHPYLAPFRTAILNLNRRKHTANKQTNKIVVLKSHNS